MRPIDTVTAHQTRAAGPEAPPDPKWIKAARDFEAVLLRQMLSSLERSAHPASRGPMSAGGNIHASMMINVLADALAASGGLGLAKEILKDGTGSGGAIRVEPDPVKNMTQGPGACTVHGDKSRVARPG